MIYFYNEEKKQSLSFYWVEVQHILYLKLLIENIYVGLILYFSTQQDDVFN